MHLRNSLYLGLEEFFVLINMFTQKNESETVTKKLQFLIKEACYRKQLVGVEVEDCGARELPSAKSLGSTIPK
jgi:hypothetical protein